MLNLLVQGIIDLSADVKGIIQLTDESSLDLCKVQYFVA